MGMFAGSIVDELRDRFSRSDLVKIVTTMATIAELGEFEAAELTYSTVQNLPFTCRQVVIDSGERGIEMISVFTVDLPGDPVVVLAAKEGRNLTLADRRRITDTYEAERLRRGV